MNKKEGLQIIIHGNVVVDDENFNYNNGDTISEEVFNTYLTFGVGDEIIVNQSKIITIKIG